MPEAAVDEDRYPHRSEHDVGTAPHPRKRSLVDAEAQPLAVESPAEGNLGGGVPLPLPLHPQLDLRSRGRRPVLHVSSQMLAYWVS